MPSVPIDTLSGIGRFSKDYFPHNEWPVLKEDFLRLPNRYSFDLDRLRYEIKKTIASFPLKPFPLENSQANKKYYGYQGICLTAKPNSPEPLYDGLKLNSNDSEVINKKEYFFKMASEQNNSGYPELSESGFTEKTLIYKGYLAEVLDKFLSPKLKIKITKMRPRGVLPPHVDFPYYRGVRLHAALETNSECIIEIEGKSYHVPADGNFYWIDSGKYHAAWNDGKTDKIHLCVNLRPYYNQSGELVYTSERSFIDLLESGLL